MRVSPVSHSIYSLVVLLQYIYLIRQSFNMVVSNTNNAAGSSMPQETAQDDLNVSSANPLLEQLSQVNYPKVKFWTRNSWNKSDTGFADIETDARNVADRGLGRQAQGVNVTYTFMEDENGTLLSGFTTRAINTTAREIWQELKKRNKAPKTWLTGASTSVRNFYRVEMYRRHHQLRFCENHWKVDFIASNSYPGWYRRHVLGKNGIKDESSDETPSSTVPRKRPALTEKSSGRPKKLKVPGSALAAPKPTEEASAETIPLSSVETDPSSDSLSSVFPATSTTTLSPVLSDSSLQALPNGGNNSAEVAEGNTPELPQAAPESAPAAPKELSSSAEPVPAVAADTPELPQAAPESAPAAPKELPSSAEPVPAVAADVATTSLSTPIPTPVPAASEITDVSVLSAPADSPFSIVNPL